MNVEYVVVADWGSSHLRAFLCQLDPRGKLTLIASAKGVGVTKIDEQFEQHLFSVIGPWREQYGQFPILLSGQIGSSVGWKETKYLACPVSPDQLATACLSFNCQEHPIFIVPGVSCEISPGHPDVMRGEELQVLGLVQQNEKYQQGRHLICLPGTHTKWVLLEDGKIQLFKTAITGELYDLLTNHSVLIQKKTDLFDLSAYELGVQKAIKSDVGSFSHNIFSVRTKQLFGQLTQDNACSYLSGLLIASDVNAAIIAKEWTMSEFEDIAIVGSSHLSERFEIALKMQGINSNVVDDTEIAITGYTKICNSLFAR